MSRHLLICTYSFTINIIIININLNNIYPNFINKEEVGQKIGNKSKL